jgi:hypothetical protein
MRNLSPIAFFLLSASHAVAGVQTERLYLSGRGSDSTVLWDFMVTGGRRANGWTKIPVPSNWELQGFGSYNYGHDKPKADEKGMYRCPFTVPEGWKDKRVFVVFEGSMMDTEVRINDQLAGPVHQGGFYRFEYDITPLLKPGQNLLEATVSKMSANASINEAEREADYWVFGGIFRPVYLKAVPTEFIDWTAIDARADGSFAITVHVGNRASADRVETQLIGLDGRRLGTPFSAPLGGASKATLTTRVSGQKNWTAETPHLYNVDALLQRGKEVLHAQRERFGFRTIEVRDGEGIFLNGSRIVLKGCNRHSFWPTTGRALNRSQCLRDVLTLKEMNMNAVRMSHYPPDVDFLELCDEYGLYVLDELAGWQKPPYDTGVGKRLVGQVVKRDVNHPSILFWDNGNEGGWNAALDDIFGLYDLQNRRVLHPWEFHGGIDTDHYENYASVQEKLQSGRIFMPTEHLHGLYDGGGGAGLDDHWRLMWGNPLTGGAFLWVYADEGVVRTDRNGEIDTDGNHAPDGILGPFHEREASFYTVREIWSPIYIETNETLPAQAASQLPVQNRYDFTNLKECRFRWRLLRYRDPWARSAGSDVLREGMASGPDVGPHQGGALNLGLPDDWTRADGLEVTAYDPTGREVQTWRWQLRSARAVRSRIVTTAGEAPSVRESASSIHVTAGALQLTFNKSDGSLIEVEQGAQTIPFGGPRLAISGRKAAGASEAKATVRKDADAVVIEIRGHTDFSRLEWTVLPSGWVGLRYRFSHRGDVDYMGVSFGYPESRVNHAKWLGKGPYRVWRNRIKGGGVDVWQTPFRNFKTNTRWEYPESVGYFGALSWLVLGTSDGPITVMTDDDDRFLRLYSQQSGQDPRFTAMVFPEGDVSFLHAIPAVGTKFVRAENHGPQGKRFQASGDYEGTLYFFFGQAPER